MKNIREVLWSIEELLLPGFGIKNASLLSDFINQSITVFFVT